MKRNHTILEYKTKLRKLRDVRPDISITTDFIVGFPGETEADFEATMQLIEELRFDSSFSFVYSARPGTPAAEYPDDTPEDVKRARLQRLQQLNNTHAAAISRQMVGTVQAHLWSKVRRARTYVSFAGARRTTAWLIFLRTTRPSSASSWMLKSPKRWPIPCADARFPRRASGALDKAAGFGST